MEYQEELEKAVRELNYEEVSRIYDELYSTTNDMYDNEEGLPIDLCITQKAALMSDFGKLTEALGIYQTILEMKNLECGENSRGALTVRQNMGNVFLQQNKVEDALELLRDVLEKQEELLGAVKDSDRPDVYETRHLIAIALERQGKLEEALAVYEQVYEAYVEFFGGQVDITAHVGFIITSLKLRAAALKENLNLDDILGMIGYGPTVFSIKRHWDNGKDTVLHRAVVSNVAYVVRIVVEKIMSECGDEKEKVKEFLNFENSENETPLTLGIKYGCEESVGVLLEKGIGHGLNIKRVLTYERNPTRIVNYVNRGGMKALLASYNIIHS